MVVTTISIVPFFPLPITIPCIHALFSSQPPCATVDVNNGGVSVFRINTRAEPMLCGLNYTAHMHCDNVRY